jgi:hypothetical protein
MCIEAMFDFCRRARAFWLIVAMLHHFMREQEIFGWNWGGKVDPYSFTFFSPFSLIYC